MKNLQRLGDLAALCHTTALSLGMLLSFTVMYPLLETTQGQAQVFLSEHHTLARVWTWLVAIFIRVRKTAGRRCTARPRPGSSSRAA